jgi:translation elongation factor EF-1beta
MCVVEDEKVSIDELQEKIQDFEDFVQVQIELNFFVTDAAAKCEIPY